MTQMSKILVTGGSGFIGSYVIDELLGRGYEVLVLDRSAPGPLRCHKGDARVSFFHGDVMDDVAVTEAAAHVDGVIHLAAVLGTQETISNPRPAAKTNILGSLNVFEAAVQYGLPVVYAGVGNHWMREHGTGAYTISKTAVEDFAKMYNAYRGAEISVVRPVNAYGPRQSVAAPYGPSKVRKIMPAFICRALTGADIEVYGDGTQVSDCVFVADVARVFVSALEHTHEFGRIAEAVGVGPLESHCVNEVAEMVIKAVASLTGEAPVGLKHLPMRPGEVPNAVVSAGQSGLTTLGMSSEDFVSLEDGIAATVHYYERTWLPGWKARQ